MKKVSERGERREERKRGERGKERREGKYQKRKGVRQGYRVDGKLIGKTLGLLYQ